MIKRTFLSFSYTAIIVFSGAGLALAQDVNDAAMTASSQDTPKSEPSDEVVATGTLQRDKAMAAYLSGDFATAEVEFDRNAFCALRVTRNFRASVEAAQDSSIRGEVGGIGPNNVPQPTGNQGGGAPSLNISSFDFQKDKSIAARTCEGRGFQLYMRGLSQLKLGKMDEAKESFTRAVALRKTIHDAYFRLALLEYQAGDKNKAQKHFKRLRKLSAKCRKCESKQDIQSQVDYLKNLLG